MNQTAEEIKQRIERLSISRIFRCYNQLQDIITRNKEKLKPETLAFYQDLETILLQAAQQEDIIESLGNQIQLLRFEKKFAVEQCNRYSQALQKYTTASELMITEQLDQYRQAINKRLEALKSESKKQ